MALYVWVGTSNFFFTVTKKLTTLNPFVCNNLTVSHLDVKHRNQWKHFSFYLR